MTLSVAPVSTLKKTPLPNTNNMLATAAQVSHKNTNLIVSPNSSF